MQRLGAIAVRVERFDERVHLDARPAEHEGRRRILDVEHALQGGRLVRARHDVGHLTDARQLAGAAFSRAMVMRAGDRGALRDRENPRRHRRREERRLPRRGRGLQDRVDVLGEAHVEHLVGLVEHEHLDVDRSSDPRRR